MRRIVAIGLVAVCVSVAFGQSAVVGGRAINTLKLLEQRIPDVSLQEAPLDQVMTWVAQNMNINVVVRWQNLEAFGIDRDKPITIQVKNLRLSQVLWLIMNEAGGADLKLAYRASGDLLIMSTAEDLGQEMVVKAYDVSDLLVRVPNFAGPQIDLSQAGQRQGQGGGGGQSLFTNDQNDEDRDQDRQGEGIGQEMQRLVDLITQTIEPDSWSVNGGLGTINAFRNMLVIRNSIFVHQRLGGYLEEDLD